MDAEQTVKTIRRSMRRPGSVGKFDEILSRSAKRGVARHSVEDHDDPNDNPDWSASRQKAPYKAQSDSAYWDEGVADAGDPNKFAGEDDFQMQVRRAAMEAVDETLTDDEAVALFEHLLEEDSAFAEFVEGFDGELLIEAKHKSAEHTIAWKKLPDHREGRWKKPAHTAISVPTKKGKK